MEQVAAALAEDQPLPLLAVVSSLVAAFDARDRHPFSTPEEFDLPAVDEVVQTFFDVPMRETSALLATIAVLTTVASNCSSASARGQPRGATSPPTSSSVSTAESPSVSLNSAVTSRPSEAIGAVAVRASEMSADAKTTPPATEGTVCGTVP
jgi:hypothetical protein